MVWVELVLVVFYSDFTDTTIKHSFFYFAVGGEAMLEESYPHTVHTLDVLIRKFKVFKWDVRQLKPWVSIQWVTSLLIKMVNGYTGIKNLLTVQN